MSFGCSCMLLSTIKLDMYIIMFEDSACSHYAMMHVQLDDTIIQFIVPVTECSATVQVLYHFPANINGA